MGKYFVSIKTRFIILFSTLIAVVLLLQFYFMDKAQQEIVDELNRMSLRINAATDIIFVGEDNNLPGTVTAQSEAEEDLLKPGMVAVLDEDQNDFVVRVETKTADRGSTKTTVSTTFRRKPKEEIKEVMEDLAEITISSDSSSSHVWNWSAGKDKIPGVKKAPKRLLERLRHKGDSLQAVIEEIHANPPGPKDKTFSFMVPNLSSQGKPRIVKYNYNTENLYHTFESARNRNVIVTVILLAISIIGIFLIARSFEKPIHEIRDSFTSLEGGNLDVRVSEAGNDEMGQLAASFNNMVDELKKNREKEHLLNRKERFAALGQLAAGVAHEIKNPLNAINLTITHLRDKFLNKSDKAALEYIKSIQLEINRLDKTVNDFLNYVRSDNLELKKSDIHALIESICLLFEREIQHNNVVVEKKYKTKTFNAEIDPERFKTALVNIILNAIQAMPRGGTLTITSDSAQGTLTIADSGPGIAEKGLANIFDFFYTTKAGGTGLGLPAAYKIIKAHGGEIDIQSKTGEGTRVTISLNRSPKRDHS